jgi:putative membrane protein
MMYGGWGWGAWLGGAVMMVAFWALVFWAIVSLVRRPSGDVRSATETPNDVLAARFARGEIDADEYDRRRRVLQAR